jgi:hypothetical protein
MARFHAHKEMKKINILKLKKSNFNQCMDYCEVEIAKEIVSRYSEPKEIKVIYSMYEKNFDDIAVKGKCLFVKIEDAFFSNGKGLDFQVELNNPTIMDVVVACNDMILTVKDFHHVFLESFDKSDELTRFYGIDTYEFFMGS